MGVGNQLFSSIDENACWLSDLKPAFNQEKFLREDKCSDLLIKEWKYWANPDNFKNNFWPELCLILAVPL